MRSSGRDASATARIALAVVLVAVVVGAMVLTSGNMSDLRVALPPLSNAMSWLEGLPVPVDMDHVALFTAITCAARLRLPRLRWWWIAFGVVVLALGTEILQVWIPGRTPKLQDARDDLIGGAAGLLIGSVPLWLGRFAPRVVGVSGALLMAGVALLPLQQWSPLGAFGFPVLLSDLLFAMAIGVRSLAWAGGQAPLRLNGLHGWLLAYVAAMGLACLMLWPPVRSQESSGFVCVLPAPQLWASVGKWIGVVYLAALATLVADIAREEAWVKRLVLAWIAGAAVTALLSMAAIAGFYLSPEAGWLQPLLSHYGSLPSGPFPRVRGLFENANMACNFLVVSACLMLAAGAARWVQPRVATLGLMGIVLAAVSTLSPGLGGLALAACLWLGWRAGTVRARRGWIVAGALVATVVMAMMWINPVDPLHAPSIRWQIWQQAAAYWSAHPWLGGGLAVPVVGVAFTDPSGNAQWLTDAHNTWLNIGGQAGLLGVIVLAGLCLRLVRGGFRGIHAKPTDPWPRALLIAFVAAFIYGGLAGSFEDARHLWVLIGLLAAVDPVSFRSSPQAPAQGSTAK